MKQTVAGSQTECGDKTVYRLAHRMAVPPQLPVVPCSRYRQRGSAGWEHFKSQKIVPYLNEGGGVANSLQYFAEYQISQAKALSGGFSA